MRPSLLAVLLCATLPAAAAVRAQTVHEQAAHEHGVARLDIVWIEGDLQLQLAGPAYSFLGFERAPGSEAERATVRRVRQTLADALALYALPPAADCRVVVAELELDLPGDSGQHVDSDPQHGTAEEHEHEPALALDSEGGAHSEWRIHHRLECRAAEALQQLAPTLFERFENLQRLDYQLITASRQDGGRLLRAAGPSRIELDR